MKTVKLLKAALVWLVMLAIPAQGFAAATMLFCGPMHERMGAGTASAHAHSNGVEPGHDHHAAPMERAAGAGLSDATFDPERSGEFAKSTCSACANCCVGTALVAVSASLPLIDAASEPVVSIVPHSIGFVTDGPKRPPRSSDA